MPTPTMDELVNVFNAILKSKGDSRMALKQPSAVFAKYGLDVPEPQATDAIIYEVAPELRAHFLAAASGNPHPDAVLGCSSPKCIACKAGLGVGVAAAVAVALEGGAAAAAAIETIAEFTGLSEATVKAIITGSGGGVGSVIDDLCSAMGAC